MSVLLMGMLAGLLAMVISMRMQLQQRSGAAVLLAAIVCGAAGALGQLLVAGRARRAMYRIAREHGYAVCVECGHDMRDPIGPIDLCPSCGALNPPAGETTAGR